MSTQNTDTVDVEAIIGAFDADDPALSPAEKETTLRFARDEDVASFYTSEAGIGRRLVAHPETVVENVVIRDGSARPTKPPGEVDGGEHVVGVRGTVPISALKIRASTRSNDQHAAVVSQTALEEVGE